MNYLFIIFELNASYRKQQNLDVKIHVLRRERRKETHHQKTENEEIFLCIVSNLAQELQQCKCLLLSGTLACDLQSVY